MTQLSTRFLHAVSLVVTDRRWAATLSAMALGFGLFIGVAIGPGASGTQATPTQILEVPVAHEEDASEEEVGGDGGSAAPSGQAGAGGGGEASLPGAGLPAPIPLAPETAEPPPPTEEPASAPVQPAPEEPDQPQATELKGTVVHANPAAGSYALAIKGGELVPVHARRLPQTGSKLTVAALQLANGTFAEANEPERSGKATRASFRGVVTFLDPDPAAPAYTVSGRGASLLVQVPPDPTGVVPSLPARGSYVTVGVAIEPGAVLLQREQEVETGEPSTYLDLSGIYEGLSPDTGQLLLSADDTRASEQDLALAVPPKIKTTKLEIGDSFLATATVEPDGSLTLAGLASDEHTKGADDAASAQGDLKR